MTLASAIILGIGSALAIFYIILIFKSSGKYDDYIQNLNEKKHFFKTLYPVGFYVLDRLSYQYSSKLDKKRLKECIVIHGPQFGEYYFRLNYAQKVSVCLFLLPFTFLIYPLINSPIGVLAGAITLAAAYYYYDMQITDVMEKRSEEIRCDLSKVMSKLTLLVNAGMILTEAWDKISYTGESTLYIEMQQVTKDIKNGVSEADALIDFSNRCASIEVKKFISTLTQSLSKGNEDLSECLRTQTALTWEEKKQSVKQQGEKASSKLLIPIAIMFVGVLIFIIVPIFANLSLF